MDNPNNSPINSINSIATTLEKPSYCSKVLTGTSPLPSTTYSLFSATKVIVLKYKSYSVIPLLKPLPLVFPINQIKNQSPHNKLQSLCYLTSSYFSDLTLLSAHSLCSCISGFLAVHITKTPTSIFTLAVCCQNTP